MPRVFHSDDHRSRNASGALALRDLDLPQLPRDPATVDHVQRHGAAVQAGHLPSPTGEATPAVPSKATARHVFAKGGELVSEPESPSGMKRFDADIAPKVAVHVRRGVTPYVAAELEGVPRSTHYDWMRWGKEGHEPYLAYSETVARAVAEWRATLETQVSDHAVTLSNSGTVDTKTAQFILERRFKEDYGRTLQLEANANAVREIIARLREGLDPSTFQRVLGILDPEGSAEPENEGTRVH